MKILLLIMVSFIVMEATVNSKGKKKQFEVFHNGDKVGVMTNPKPITAN